MPTASPRVSSETKPVSSLPRGSFRSQLSDYGARDGATMDERNKDFIDDDWNRTSAFALPPNEQKGESSKSQQQWHVLKQRFADEPSRSSNGSNMRASKSAYSDKEHSHDFSGDSLVRLALADDGWIFGYGMQALQQQAQDKDEAGDDGRSKAQAPPSDQGVHNLHANSQSDYSDAVRRMDIAAPAQHPSEGRPENEGNHQYLHGHETDINADDAKMGLQIARDPAQDGADSTAAMTSNGNASVGLTRDGSIARTNAIAMLKRAASQREMRNKSPGPRLLFQEPESSFLPTGSSSPGTFDTAGMGDERATPIASELLDIRYVTTPGGDSVYPVQASRPISPSVARSTSRGGDSTTTGHGMLGANLSRSASRLGGGGNKSPLPSLEQLRARILQERTTAGLARSASTSAASAAARQYAMEKLLGTSFREGAVSPVSDTAEEQEEENKRMSVVKVERPLLRRSRTIGGLSASAEAQRKAAFAEALDKDMPGDASNARRGSRRFAHGPTGGERNVPQEGMAPDPSLQRNASQRQVARTEMLRKLSTRRGAASPASALSHHSPIAETRPTLQVAGATAGTSQADDVSSAPSHDAHTADRHLRPGLLGVPRLNKNVFSPSSRSSAGFQHEADRKRASETARLNNEEAFEYERLLELGYSTDDAWDRVTAARRSYADVPEMDNTSAQDGSTANGIHPLQLYAMQMAEHHGLPARTDESSTQQVNGAQEHREAMQDAESLAKHPSGASIPLGLDASVMTHGDLGRSTSTEERLDTPNNGLYAQSSPYPESILASPTASTINTKHESNVSQTIPVPANRSRIEALLSPGFLAEVGNPLDYSHSPSRSPQRLDGAPPHTPSATHDDAQHELGGQTVMTAAGSNGSMSTYLDNVGRMADQLGVFTRQAQRSARDAAVMNSSAAQVEAAAKDFARYQELTPTSSVAGLQSRVGSAAASPEIVRAQLSLNPFDAEANTGSPLKLSTMPQEEAVEAVAKADVTKNELPAGPPTLPPASTTEKSAASSDPYSHLYLANSKLAPFPALLTRDGSLGPPKVDGPAPATKSSAVAKTHARDASFGRSGSGSGKETFFSSLRRKASRGGSRHASAEKAASPVIDQNAEQIQERPMSPTRKLQSILTRRPSKKDGAKMSNGVNGTSHWRNGSTSKIRPSAAVPLGEIFHITAPDTAMRPLGDSPLHHGRNISASSSGTTRQLHESSALLDPGQAISPAKGHAPMNGLAPFAAEAFNRYSRVLTSSAHPETTEPAGIPGISKEQVSKPPRDYVMSSPVLQVVGVTSIKDRFAFLFTDLIVIAKPLYPPRDRHANSSPDELPTLAWTFTVKSVIELDGLRLTVPKTEQKHTKQQTPMLAQFVDEFAKSPSDAIARVVQSSALPSTPATIAQFLQQTPGLDRQQLSDYLYSARDDGALIRNFVQLEKFAGVSIESALRSLLIELRFPRRREPLQELLTAFAKRWTETNEKLIKENFTPQLAVDLVYAIMCLNDALHSRTGNAPGYFGSPNARLSNEDFVASFRAMDAEYVLSDRTLLRIYGSVNTDPLQQALHPSEVAEAKTVSIAAPGIPTRLTYGIVSDPISISIPRADADFAIRLYGEGLTFQPQILSFEKGPRQEFRILSKELGSRTIVFIRAGRNARKYQSSLHELKPTEFPLPRFANITVQRAFMKHCFTMTLPDERRYLLSVASSDQQQAWTRAVKDLTELREQSIAAGTTWATGNPHALSLHVLREALIDRDETEQEVSLQRNASTVTTGSERNGTRKITPLQGLSQNGTASQGNSFQRQGSVSKHYYSRSRPGHRERELMQGDDTLEELPEPNDDPGRHGGGAASFGKVFTGEELILTVRQNSLLPLVVAHAQRSDAV